MKYHKLLISIFITILIWSSINPKDYFTWILEVFPAVIGLIILITVYPRFKFTNLVYTLILIHSCILMVGGHYTILIIKRRIEGV
jgi:putative membrane protein